MLTEYDRGYTAGYLSAQPEWISVNDRLPTQDGNYFTITESQKDYPSFPKGTIAIDITDSWHEGEWYQDDDCWKVLYWAKPVNMLVPEELKSRPRAGAL